MSNTTQNTLKYANIQMAAEADFLGVTNFQSGAAIEAALVRGNNRSSRFAATQAAEFTNATEGWSVVDHRANTSTGFSGTLFKSKGKIGVRLQLNPINTGATRARIDWLATTFDGVNSQLLMSKG